MNRLTPPFLLAASLALVMISCRLLGPTGLSLGDVWTRPADGMVMVYVPGGTFQMGSSDVEIDGACSQWEQALGSGNCYRDYFEDESPLHSVTLDSFWIDQTEVTNAQFAAFLNEQGNQMEGGVTWLDLEDTGCRIEENGGEFRPKDSYTDHPVVEVSWYGADAYCTWAGGRLPTEAEWEYAARGSEGWRYPWGDEFDGARLNYCDGQCSLPWTDETVDDGYAATAPVRSYPEGASWCGALDMVGNVWEWVADWYGHYPSDRQVNPTGTCSGEARVLRGGSWKSDRGLARCAYRHRLNPDFSSDFIGFRCVSPVP